MRRTIEERGVEEVKEDTEITLGAGSLLAIFLGMMLVCGLVFGFGYSMGRHRGVQASAPSGTEAGATQAQRTRPAAGSTAIHLPEPAGSDAQLARGSAPQSSDGNNPNFPPNYATPEPDEAGGDGTRLRTAHASTGPSSTGPRSANQRMAAGVSATPPAPLAEAIPGARLMVQIAAVSRQEDAQVLSAALKKRGFSPMIRHGLADDLYHVQVGPFPSRHEAESMKDRLVGDGYNAIVK